MPRTSLTALATVAITAFVSGCSSISSAPSVALINGKDLTGWRGGPGTWQVVGGVSLNNSNNKFFVAQPGDGVLLNSSEKNTVNLVSEQEFGDCEAEIEFCVPLKSNSGVYFLGRYEVQVFDSWGVKEPKYSDCGGIYKSCSDPKPDSAGRAPSVNASKAPGEWQKFHVIFRAPRFDAAGVKTENARFVRVVHNGVVIHENVESERPTCAARWLDEKPRGPIMIQGDHGPVAYRKLVVRPLTLK